MHVTHLRTTRASEDDTHTHTYYPTLLLVLIYSNLHVVQVVATPLSTLIPNASPEAIQLMNDMMRVCC